MLLDLSSFVFVFIPTASSASPSLGTRLLRPDLGPHQGGFLPKQVEPYTRVHSSVSARLSLLLSWVAYSSLKIALVYLYYLSRQQQCKNRRYHAGLFLQYRLQVPECKKCMYVDQNLNFFGVKIVSKKLKEQAAKNFGFGKTEQN